MSDLKLVNDASGPTSLHLNVTDPVKAAEFDLGFNGPNEARKLFAKDIRRLAKDIYQSRHGVDPTRESMELICLECGSFDLTAVSVFFTETAIHKQRLQDVAEGKIT